VVPDNLQFLFDQCGAGMSQASRGGGKRGGGGGKREILSFLFTLGSERKKGVGRKMKGKKKEKKDHKPKARICSSSPSSQSGRESGGGGGKKGEKATTSLGSRLYEWKGVPGPKKGEKGGRRKKASLVRYLPLTAVNYSLRTRGRWKTKRGGKGGGKLVENRGLVLFCWMYPASGWRKIATEGKEKGKKKKRGAGNVA